MPGKRGNDLCIINSLTALEIIGKNMAQQSAMSQFGKPTGSEGEQVGLIMAEANAAINSWAVSLLSIKVNEYVLEIGFGPGVAIQELAEHTPARLIAGVDHSEIMLTQASTRNARAIQDGRVELKLGSVSVLPYQDAYFDKVFTVNSFHFWNEPSTDLTEIRRTMKPNGLFAITTQPRWVTSEQMVNEVGDQLVQWLTEAGFGSIRLEKKEMDPVSVVCAMGTYK
jgi:ubiquinone/menaquinone biosynthesis C-methylase UbiE